MGFAALVCRDGLSLFFVLKRFCFEAFKLQLCAVEI
jgi:hypothetical protein